MAQVIVYRNLNRGGWSVATVRGRVGVGRVIDHVASVTLANVRFHVQPAAQAKVAAGAARTVHAWAIGDIAECDGMRLEVLYNPRRCGFFHLEDGSRVDSAARVAFAADGRAYALL